MKMQNFVLNCKITLGVYNDANFKRNQWRKKWKISERPIPLKARDKPALMMEPSMLIEVAEERCQGRPEVYE
ncbi:hypothetical protein QQP08_005658 [Theobroma cacao]|nr:hypothetical protein QQP08_005658 [Theobroma cacao]